VKGTDGFKSKVLRIVIEVNGEASRLQFRRTMVGEKVEVYRWRAGVTVNARGRRLAAGREGNGALTSRHTAAGRKRSRWCPCGRPTGTVSMRGHALGRLKPQLPAPSAD